jgi:hypothetical protein
VLTTIGTSVTAYIFASRYQYLIISYQTHNAFFSMEDIMKRSFKKVPSNASNESSDPLEAFLLVIINKH